MTRVIMIETIRDAGPAVYAVAGRTPLVRLDSLTPSGRGDAEPTTRNHLTLDTLQPISPCQIRGAANTTGALNAEPRAAGVWTLSAASTGGTRPGRVLHRHGGRDGAGHETPCDRAAGHADCHSVLRRVM